MPPLFNSNLGSLEIESLSRALGFKNRERKITITRLLLGLWICIKHQVYSYNKWAIAIQRLMHGQGPSKQAIERQMNATCVKVFKACLAKSIHYASTIEAVKSHNYFHRILVRDSTCLRMPIVFKAAFPGPFSHKHGQSATMRIQYSVDLLSGQAVDLKISGYTDTDQANAEGLLPKLQAGDLVVEDLGYFKLAKFAQIVAKQASYVSRLKYGVNAYHSTSGKKVDWYKLLKQAEKSGQNSLELAVKLGAKEQLVARLIAIRIPETKANARIRKAKKDRHQNTNHSKAYYELLRWTILFTDLKKEDFSAQDILALYGLRWRIECIFKCWKSYFQLDQIIKNSVKNIHLIYVLILGFLIYLTMEILPQYHRWQLLLWEQKRKLLSLYKFCDFIRLNPALLASHLDQEHSLGWLNTLRRTCCYEKRKNRTNYLEHLQQILLIH